MKLRLMQGDEKNQLTYEDRNLFQKNFAMDKILQSSVQ